MLNSFFLSKHFSFLIKSGFLLDFYLKYFLNRYYSLIVFWSLFIFFEKFIIEFLPKNFFNVFAKVLVSLQPQYVANKIPSSLLQLLLILALIFI